MARSPEARPEQAALQRNQSRNFPGLKKEDSLTGQHWEDLGRALKRTGRLLERGHFHSSLWPPGFVLRVWEPQVTYKQTMGLITVTQAKGREKWLQGKS